MTDDPKYKGKYRIPSARLQNWDYGANAAYFVTICTAHREHFFGEIAINDLVETQNFASSLRQNFASPRQQNFASPRLPQMQLSEIGQIARHCWLQIPAHFPFVIPDAFVIMPNHVHGIIVISSSVETQNFASLQSRPQSQPQSRPQLQPSPQPDWQGRFGPQSCNLASIVRGFKTGVKKHATMNGVPFAWQARFHDRVIRDGNEHARIVQYIDTNIINWQKDELYD
jgi:REP element-mobilizing transposase RayT